MYDLATNYYYRKLPHLVLFLKAIKMKHNKLIRMHLLQNMFANV